MKVKVEEFEINGKINKVRDLYRGINDFKKGYQTRTTIVKDEKADLVADPPQYYGELEELFLRAVKCK